MPLQLVLSFLLLDIFSMLYFLVRAREKNDFVKERLPIYTMYTDYGTNPRIRDESARTRCGPQYHIYFITVRGIIIRPTRRKMQKMRKEMKEDLRVVFLDSYVMAHTFLRINFFTYL